MTDIAKINEAIAKHAKWKHYLRLAVDAGASEWNVASVARDDGCEFGQWLRSLSSAERARDHCQKVTALHAEFHAAAAEVLGLALAGRRDEATEAMALKGRFTKISSELTMAMSAWKKDLSAKG